jgi:hypothetical protein
LATATLSRGAEGMNDIRLTVSVIEFANGPENVVDPAIP